VEQLVVLESKKTLKKKEKNHRGVCQGYGSQLREYPMAKTRII
jgi:hypothetical protein